MIDQSKYLPAQMNGPVVNAVMQAMEEELSDADEICRYLYNLSIQSAKETELESIGCIIGYPRPLVPDNFNLENVLILTDLPFYQDISIGLSEVGSEVGGKFISNETAKSNYMEINLYRSFLDKVAYIKRYGITLYSVDQIARLIDSDYTIEWDEYADIVVTFANPIGYKNVWVLSRLFYRLATSPSVIINTATQE